MTSLKQARNRALEALKKERRAVLRDSACKARMSEINAGFTAKMKAARQEIAAEGLYWATYNKVAKAVEQACGDRFPQPPHWRRWGERSVKVAVQFQSRGPKNPQGAYTPYVQELVSNNN